MNSKQHTGFSSRLIAVVSTVAVTSLIAACGTPGNGEHPYGPTLTDKHFGDSVRAARLAQTIDVDAASKQEDATGTDGRSAALALENYEKSYSQPRQSIKVLGIGSDDNN